MGKNNPETTRKYYYKNRDRILEVRRKWEVKNKDRINKARRERRKNDPEYKAKLDIRGKSNYKNNKDNWVRYRLKNKDIINHKCRIRNKSIRMEVLNYYSNGSMECNCCGEKELDFLSIDHIDGGGYKQRKIQGVGTNLTKWLKTNDYPKGFQVLCMNCNFGKWKKGICPHQIKQEVKNELY